MKFMLCAAVAAFAYCPAASAATILSEADGSFPTSSGETFADSILTVPHISVPDTPADLYIRSGKYKFDVTFDAAVPASVTLVVQYQFRYDIYNSSGEIIDGDGGYDIFDTKALGSNITKGSLYFNVPKLRQHFGFPRTIYAYSFAGFGIDLSPLPGFRTANYHAALSSVPEPGNWSLLITGFGLVGAVIRVQRRPRLVTIS